MPEATILASKKKKTGRTSLCPPEDGAGAKEAAKSLPSGRQGRADREALVTKANRPDGKLELWTSELESELPPELQDSQDMPARRQRRRRKVVEPSPLAESSLPPDFPKRWTIWGGPGGRRLSATAPRSRWRPALLTDDEYAAHCFLSGYLQQPAEGQRFELYFLEGQLEAFGREAFRRLLRSDKPLSDVLRHDLYRLFDQRPEYSRRKLIFEFQSRSALNGHKTRVKNHAIAWAIQRDMRAGKKFNDAVESLRMAFGTKGRPAARSMITDAWREHKKHYPLEHGEEFRKAARDARRRRAKKEG